MGRRADLDYDIALRPDYEHPTWLDDVVVRDVETFRAEDMGDWWWLCCYFRDGSRITWHIARKGKRVVMQTIEFPDGDHIYEAGSIAPITAQTGGTLCPTCKGSGRYGDDTAACCSCGGSGRQEGSDA